MEGTCLGHCARGWVQTSTRCHDTQPLWRALSTEFRLTVHFAWRGTYSLLSHVPMRANPKFWSMVEAWIQNGTRDPKPKQIWGPKSPKKKNINSLLSSSIQYPSPSSRKRTIFRSIGQPETDFRIPVSGLTQISCRAAKKHRWRRVLKSKSTLRYK